MIVPCSGWLFGCFSLAVATEQTANMSTAPHQKQLDLRSLGIWIFPLCYLYAFIAQMSMFNAPVSLRLSSFPSSMSFCNSACENGVGYTVYGAPGPMITTANCQKANP